MCCSTCIFPVDPETAERILELGMFTPMTGAYPSAPTMWEREVREDDGTKVTVRGQVVGDKLNLSLYPTIQKYEHHRRVSGGVYLEIAVRVAEKCGSRIVQSSNVDTCIENSERQKVLAEYPGKPMDWAAVCVGFQSSILGSLDQM